MAGSGMIRDSALVEAAVPSSAGPLVGQRCRVARRYGRLEENESSPCRSWQRHGGSNLPVVIRFIEASAVRFRGPEAIAAYKSRYLVTRITCRIVTFVLFVRRCE